MERRINKKVQNHFHKFKNDLIEFLKTNNDSNIIIIILLIINVVLLIKLTFKKKTC